MTPWRTTAFISLIALLLVAAGGAYLYYREHQSLLATQGDLASTTSQMIAFQSALATTTNDRNQLQEALITEQGKNQVFEDQIEDLGDTVGQLDKLSKIDPQLLTKYSKVYFLSENYVPASLSSINSKLLYDPTRDLQIESHTREHLYDMMDDAHDDGIDLLIASAYRSFGTQATLKDQYTVTYGAGTANSFSAEQGYSEHQLGTALDFTTKGLNGGLDGFDQTDAYAWLNKNAYKYGFVISYPKENTFYEYEPWHWRFVGIDLATKLHRDGQYFYDLDQRELNGYLGSIFDD